MLTQQLISALSEEISVAVKEAVAANDDTKDSAAVKQRKITRVRALVETLFELAIDGKNLEAIKYIFDRVDGKMIQPLALPVPGDEGDGLYEFTLRLGHRAIDGSETATEVRLRPAVDVPQAAGGDLRAAGHNGGAR